jgi:hypothetical protein
MFEIFYVLFYAKLSAFENLEKLDLSGNNFYGPLTIQGNEQDLSLRDVDAQFPTDDVAR